MTQPSASGSNPDAGTYEIRVKGHLDRRWATSFDGLALTHGADGTTVIRGQVADQAALHGLLHRMRDLGLPLVSVVQVDPTDHPARPSPQGEGDRP